MGFNGEYAPGKTSRSCKSANENVTFTYEFSPEEDDSGKVILWFKDEKCLTADEVNALIKEHGLPETDIHGTVNAKDLSRYVYEDTGIKSLYLSVYQNYGSLKEAEEYLDSYVSGLIDQDYLPTDPQRFNSERTYLYPNEELWKYAAFSVSENAKGATVLYDLVSFENNTDDSLMMKALGR